MGVVSCNPRRECLSPRIIDSQQATMRPSPTNLALALSWAGLSCAIPAPVPQANSPPQQSIPPTSAAPTRSIPIGMPHAPFTGTPTVTGALSTATLGQTIAPKPPNPTAFGYPSNGQLNEPMPMPYMPAGGLGTNGTEPVYNVRSDFDYQSLVCFLFGRLVGWNCSDTDIWVVTCVVSGVDRI